METREDRYRKAARKIIQADNLDLDLDADATVSEDEDLEASEGAYVQTWLWVPVEYMEDA